MSAERVDAEHILHVGGKPDDTLHTAVIEHDGIAVYGTGLVADVALADALISLGTELLKRSAER